MSQPEAVYAMLLLHLYSIKGLLLSFAFSPGLGLLSFLQRQWRRQKNPHAQLRQHACVPSATKPLNRSWFSRKLAAVQVRGSQLCQAPSQPACNDSRDQQQQQLDRTHFAPPTCEPPPPTARKDLNSCDVTS